MADMISWWPGVYLWQTPSRDTICLYDDEKALVAAVIAKLAGSKWWVLKLCCHC
jgi:hypothetical protein